MLSAPIDHRSEGVAVDTHVREWVPFDVDDGTDSIRVDGPGSELLVVLGAGLAVLGLTAG